MDFCDKDPAPEKYIDPIFDTGFKLIFGRETVSERLLIDLLNNLFSGDPRLSDISELKYINSERPNEYIHGRGLRYDILCTTSTGHRFIVEMQNAEQHHFLYSSSCPVSGREGMNARADAINGFIT